LSLAVQALRNQALLQVGLGQKSVVISCRPIAEVDVQSVAFDTHCQLPVLPSGKIVSLELRLFGIGGDINLQQVVRMAVP
jgi:hypothetical protein